MASKVGALLKRLFTSGSGQSPSEFEQPKKRGYEGAAQGRHGAHWYTGNSTSDAEIARSGPVLRSRSRDLDRNNPLARKIINTHASYFVGPGIVPRAKTGDDKLNESINELFDEWSKVCEVQGRYDFYGLSLLSARMMVMDGEAFVRRRWRRASDQLPVPLQLEILDSEFCDWNKNGEAGKNIIVNGVEYDKIGRRRGYWLFNQNPLSTLLRLKSGLTSSFVPANEVVHLFEPLTNQSRGAPWLAPVMTELRDVRDYEVSENIRKKTEACLVGVVIPGDEEDDPNVGLEEDRDGHEPPLRDVYGNALERMEPGMFAVAYGGKDIRFNTPAASAGIEAYLRTRYRTIAAGGRLPYELMTGDFSQANFASGKLGLQDYKRFVETVQWQILIFQSLQRQWDWFVEAAKVAGRIPMNVKVGVEWQAPEFESIDRLDEAKADLADIRMGKRSPQEIIAKTGRNPSTVLSEIDEWFSKVDQTKSGMIFDSDPRKVSSVGQAHQTQNPPGDNDNA